MDRKRYDDVTARAKGLVVTTSATRTTEIAHFSDRDAHLTYSIVAGRAEGAVSGWSLLDTTEPGRPQVLEAGLMGAESALQHVRTADRMAPRRLAAAVIDKRLNGQVRL